MTPSGTGIRSSYPTRMGTMEGAAAPPEAVLPAVCVNCGAARTGSYCADCGQREVRGPHTLGSLLAGALGRILTVDSGLLHTAHRLMVSPGQVIRDYLAGRTQPYTHPATYLLISFAAFALSGRLFSGATAGEGDQLFIALLIPFVAAVSRALFWRVGRNYAEHLIIVLYIAGHVAMLLAVVQIPLSLADEATARAAGYGAIAFGVAYVPWAYSRVFPSRAFLAAAGGLGALAGGAMLWTVVMVKLLELLRG